MGPTCGPGTDHAPRARMRQSLLPLMALLATSAAAADERPLFIELPHEVLASDVGANGFVVVGSYFYGGGFTWMPTADDISLGGRAANGVSRDGRTIVGDALDANGNENAAIFTGSGWRTLGSIRPGAEACDRLLSSGYGTSGDGRVVVGLAWDGCLIARAFRWEESTGMVDLGSTVPGQSSRASEVSGDGKVVVGFQEDVTGFRMGAIWRDGRQQLVPGPYGLIGEAQAVNRDGSIVAGTGCNPYDTQPSAWRWTVAGVECLPVRRPPSLQPYFYKAIITSMSDDGRVMGGSFTFGLEAESLIWLDGQVHFLKDFLRENGAPEAFRGWVNSGFVTGVSPDGGTLVGYGAGQLNFRGFVVVLPKGVR
jgi:probable HAF family extracellular repeat protein